MEDQPSLIKEALNNSNSVTLIEKTCLVNLNTCSCLNKALSAGFGLV